jgi:serine phosphatase RsbU (regulator of sigma subunit)
MGHGVRAALGTALIRGLVDELSSHESDPGSYLGQLNEALHPIMHSEDEILFASACYMIIDISNGTLRFANAGHPSPLVLATPEHRAEPLLTESSNGGPALAIAPDISYTTYEITLSANDAVIMFTDGIYEVTNQNNEEFGETRLMESASRHCDLPLPHLFNALLNDACHFAADGSFEDDICLVGFRLKELLISP